MNLLVVLNAIILAIAGMFNVSNVQDNVTNYEDNATEQMFVIDEISDSNYAYDFTDKDVIKSLSDLVIIGKISSIKEVSNYIPKLDVYSATRTYTDVEIVDILYRNNNNEVVSSNNLKSETIPVVFYGGTIPYREYEKSLKEAQKEKRATLMGIGDGIKTRDNVYIRTKERQQLDISENEEYVLYLEYNEIFDAFVTVSAEHGVLKYDVSSKTLVNHLSGEIEKIEEI